MCFIAAFCGAADLCDAGEVFNFTRCECFGCIGGYFCINCIFYTAILKIFLSHSAYSPVCLGFQFKNLQPPAGVCADV
jgi:hypothetical protein